MNLDILGMCEIRWSGNGQFRTERATMYNSGSPEDDANYRHGVAILVSRRLVKSENTAKKQQMKKINISNPKNPDIKNNFSNILNIKITGLNAQPDRDVEETWKQLKETAMEQLGIQTNKGKEEWMTNEILVLMEQRRMHKNEEITYKNILRIIRRKIREAKETWINAKCQEIE